MTIFEALLLLVGGASAGVVNAMAGGGSMLTVPLLVLAGVPGVAANGSNRVGILTSSVTTWVSFRRRGVTTSAPLTQFIAPAVAGALLGAYGIDALFDDAGFERFFGLLMIPIIILTIYKPKVAIDQDPWPKAVTVLVFFAIGIYAGAIQAGTGLLLLAALSRSGIDLVTANLIKVIFTLVVTAFVLPVYLWQGNVHWGPALILAAGLSAGGWIGARVAVHGGERWIRFAMIGAALALAVRLMFFA